MIAELDAEPPPTRVTTGEFLMESLVTELVWLVTNYQAWVVGVLLFGDPHVWYRRYSFFEILALCKDAGTAPATRRKNFLVFEFLMQHLLWL